MIKLLIIADDLTGALDTGVKLSQKGARAEVCITHSDYKNYGHFTDVLIVNTDSRHLSAPDAYKRVFDVASFMYGVGVRKFYKKTDSVLRGNPGAELRALQDAVKGVPVYFAPAFPALGRTTKSGIQYVDGIPIAQTVFGSDPFTPVRSSDVAELLGLQYDGKIRKIKAGDIPENVTDEILVYDAETDEDLEKAARTLHSDPLLMAGCGGFANFIFDRCGLEKSRIAQPDLPKSAVVFSGSIHPVTHTQIAALESAGVLYVTFDAQQLELPFFSQSRECAEIIKRAAATAGRVVAFGTRTDRSAIIEASSVGLKREQAELKREQAGLAREQAGLNLGEIGKQLLDRFSEAVFIIVGGDTLLSLLQTVNCTSLRPIGEPLPGCALSTAAIFGQQRYLITKSGGFGDEETLKLLTQYVLNS